jgi:hypothetical protein
MITTTASARTSRTMTRYARSLQFTLAFALAVALFVTALPAQAQWWGFGGGKRGSGKIITSTRDLASFSGVDVTGSNDTFISPGSKQEVRIEVDDNIVDDVTTEVRGGVLYIGMKNGNYNNVNLKVYVTIPTLENVRLSGSGDINIANGFTMNKLETKLSGSGDITYKGGTAKEHTVILSGSGDITSFNLETDQTTVRLVGSGDCSVNVKSKLDARISGSGDITYKGSPQVSQSVVGSGDIHQKH